MTDTMQAPTATDALRQAEACLLRAERSTPEAAAVCVAQANAWMELAKALRA